MKQDSDVFRFSLVNDKFKNINLYTCEDAKCHYLLDRFFYLILRIAGGSILSNVAFGFQYNVVKKLK